MMRMCIMKSDRLSVNEIKEEEKVVVAGIAKPKPFFDFLEAKTEETIDFFGSS